MSDTISLADLGITADPGTDWHPRDKPGARDAYGNLVDLSGRQVAEHVAKPEADDHPDAGVSLSAEDSAITRDGVV